MIEIKCPMCGNSFRVRDEYAGKVGKCKYCKETVKVPEIEKPKPVETPATAPAPVAQMTINEVAEWLGQKPPEQKAAEPQIVYIERPAPSYNVPRIIIVISSTIGALATFMPWVSTPLMSLPGSGGEAGWITFTAHLFIVALAIANAPYQKIPEVCKFLIILAAIFLIVYTIYKISTLNSIISRDDSILMRVAVQVGFGLYAVGLTAAVDLVALFLSNRER